MPYHSQFGEDAWIHQNLWPPKGIFCEVGAYDGVESSNTLVFEQEFGWTGVCIEPVPLRAAQCRDNRKCLTWCCAAGPRALLPYFNNPYEPQKPVVVIPLDEILTASGVAYVDLLSIDTENTELEVWKTRGRFLPRIVVIEFLSEPGHPRDREIVTQLSSEGYREVHRTTANLIFTLAKPASGG